MNNFKGMKIQVTKDQPLEEIVRELEKKGLKKSMFSPNKYTRFIITNEFGKFTDAGGFDCGFFTNKKLTTLAELKEM